MPKYNYGYNDPICELSLKIRDQIENDFIEQGFEFNDNTTKEIAMNTIKNTIKKGIRQNIGMFGGNCGGDSDSDNNNSGSRYQKGKYQKGKYQKGKCPKKKQYLSDEDEDEDNDNSLKISSVDKHREKVPRSAYNLYVQEQSKIVESNGQRGAKMKTISTMWKKISDNEKEIYQQRLKDIKNNK